MASALQDKLTELKSLFEMGLLTDADYQEQKRALLSAHLGTTAAGTDSLSRSGTTKASEALSPPLPTTLDGQTTVPLPDESTAFLAPLSGATTRQPDPRGGVAGPARGSTLMGQAKRSLSSDVTTLPPGSVVDGRYSVVSTLGVGGMGAVYQAVDTQLNHLVALKALRPEITQDPRMVDLLRQEVALAQRLNHPNLLTLRHLDTDGDAPYVVMELMDGGDLEEHLASKGGRLAPAEALPFFQAVLSGLAALHQEKIAHLDVKPANVLLGRDGRVKLSDFGISSRLKDQRGGGLQAGTPEYAPPEQLSGKETDVRADLYAVGILVHEVLAGALPFAAKTVEGARAWHQKGERTFPALSPAVASVVAKATAVRPSDRYRSADALQQALREAIQQKPWTVLDPEAVATLEGRLHGAVELPDGTHLPVDDPAALLAHGAAWPTARTVRGNVLLQTHSLALLWLRRKTPGGGLSKEAQAAAMALLEGDLQPLLRLPSQPPVDECALALLAFHSGEQSTAVRRLDEAERRLASLEDRIALCVALAGGLGTTAQLSSAISEARQYATSAGQLAETAVATAFLLSDKRQAQRIVLEVERTARQTASALLVLAQTQLVLSKRPRDWSHSQEVFYAAAEQDTAALEAAARALPEVPEHEARLEEILLTRVKAAEESLRQRGLPMVRLNHLSHVAVEAFCRNASHDCTLFDENEERRNKWEAADREMVEFGFEAGAVPDAVSASELDSKRSRVDTAVAAQQALQARWARLLARAAKVGFPPPDAPRPLGDAAVEALSAAIERAAEQAEAARERRALEAELEADNQRVRDAGLSVLPPPQELSQQSLAAHTTTSTMRVEESANRSATRARQARAAVTALAVAVAVALVLMVGTLFGDSSSQVQTKSPRPDAPPPAPALAGRFAGAINEAYAIELDLATVDTNLYGTYSYVGNSGSLELKGEIEPNGRFTLREFNSKGTMTGTFTGTFDGTRAEGLWVKTDGLREMPFSFVAVANPSGSSPPNSASSKKAALLRTLVGEHPLSSISGMSGANSLFDYSNTGGRWRASGSSIHNAMREGYDIDLSVTDRRRLRSMKVVVKPDLSVTVVCDGRPFHTTPFDADRLDHSLAKPFAEYPSAVPSELGPQTTFIGAKLYLLVRDSISFEHFASCNVAPMGADSMLLLYDSEARDFTLRIFEGDCCNQADYTFD